MRKEKTLTEFRRNKIIVTLHDKFYHALKSLAMVLTLDESEADELVALTFNKICFWSNERLKKIHAWDTPSIYVYLAKTLSNTNIDIQRKKSKQKQLETKYTEHLGDRFEHSPEATYVAKENIRIIKKAYHETLVETDRVIRVAFYLRTERGYRNKDIAEKFNQSPNTIGTNFRRLRLKIKEKIS